MTDFFTQMADALMLHDWRLAAGLACIAAVAALRYLSTRIPGRVGAFFKSDRGGATLALATGVLGALGKSLSEPGPLSPQLIVDGVVIGVTASGGYSTVRRLMPSGWAKPAATAILLCLAITSASACAWLQAHPRVAGALNCAAADAEGQVASALPGVVSALSGAKPDWTAIGTLEISHGVDVIVCAVERLLAPTTARAELDPAVEANARAYLRSRGR